MNCSSLKWKFPKKSNRSGFLTALAAAGNSDSAILPFSTSKGGPAISTPPANTICRITADDLAALVANARTSTIFALVAAMGQGNCGKALEILDSLVRKGEYLPKALMFAAGQFKYALIAHEAWLKNSMQITGHFTKLGIRMWRDRAEQVAQTVSSFPQTKAERAVRLLAAADRDLRDTRPDDRTVFENLILAMTA
jgi:DNA polymerase III delta subunit